MGPPSGPGVRSLLKSVGLSLFGVEQRIQLLSEQRNLSPLAAVAVDPLTGRFGLAGQLVEVSLVHTLFFSAKVWHITP
jgi:hypothetical protein